jgi:hypothetical protein
MMTTNEEMFKGFRRFVVSLKQLDENPTWGPGADMKRTVVQASDASVAAARAAAMWGVDTSQIEVSAI